MQTEKKSVWWIYALSGFLLILIGLGIWYYLTYPKETFNLDSISRKQDSVKPVIILNQRNLTISDATNSFGLNTLKLLDYQNENKQNVFISPLSLSMIMNLVLNGSDGQTKIDIQKALGESYLNLEEVNNFERDLIASYTLNTGDTELFVANSLWVDSKNDFQKNFIDLAKNKYMAEVQSLDLTEQISIDIINKWVAKKTKDKITKIFDGPNPASTLDLVNAVYFKSKWMTPFDKNLTQKKGFQTLDSKVQADLMNDTNNYKYFENKDFQLVSIVYKNSDLSMIVALPKANDGIGKFVKSLDSTSMMNYISEMESKKVNLTMPKFKANFEYQTPAMKKVFEEMGMSVVFTSQADFSKMLIDKKTGEYTNQKISEVVHKTFIDVNEESTEAAAVTGIGMATLSTAPPVEKPIQMLVDHPYYFSIYDSKNKIDLFSGIVYNPVE